MSQQADDSIRLRKSRRGMARIGRRLARGAHGWRGAVSAGLRLLTGREPVIHLYCLCWNEERLLPFFFRHYDSLVDRYFVFDNGSTDGSLALLRHHPKVTVGRFDVSGDSLVTEACAFYEAAWHASRGIADWVLIVNIDELLYHPRGRAYFSTCARKGVTVIPASGYEMIAEQFPPSTEPLHRSVTRGIASTYLNKLCAFQPDAIHRIGYTLGRHGAHPEGNVVRPARQELKLLHYKYLGQAYLIDRFQELNERLRPGDREIGAGYHYDRSPETLAAMHGDLLAAAKPVPGL